jgi:outer membrane biosynthesis protein TonB
MKLSFWNFLRYRKDELSGKGKNLIERELQKDPFAEEAMDGLSSVSAEDASRDLKKLQGILESRTKRSRRFIIYRIAASVAVLMIISSVFIILNRENSGTRISETAGMPKVAEIRRNEPIMQPEEELKEEKSTEDNVGKQPRVRKDFQLREESKKTEVQEPAEMVLEEQQPAEKAVNPDVNLVRDYSARSLSIAAAPGKRSPGKVEGTIYSAEDNMPVAGASVVVKGSSLGVITDTNGKFSLNVPDTKATLVASYIGMLPQEFSASKDTSADIKLQPSTESLSEVVVVGYGTQKKSDEAAAEYTPPRPVNGQAKFNRYIEENIRRPDSTSGQRVVVVAGFRVLADGSIDSIKIIRSPAKAFSDEAIRLIESGPGWQPAMRDGVKVDDDVRIRIVFR